MLGVEPVLVVSVPECYRGGNEAMQKELARVAAKMTQKELASQKEVEQVNRSLGCDFFGFDI